MLAALVASLVAQVGVPVDGYPSYEERATLVAINRARSAPNDVMLGNASACSAQVPAQKPLMLSIEGSRAARFHSNNSIRANTGLSHNSYCTLRDDIATTGCDGSPACACVAGTECFSCMTLGGCGSTPWTRTALFGFGANGEVGAAGQGDGFAATFGWVTECPPADGHRTILTGGGIDVIGLGYAGGGSQCWSPFWFGDTGFQGVSTAVLASGVHVPERGSAVDFYVNYYADGAPADDVFVVVDGVCHAMALEGGVATNATFRVARNLGSGCHEYWFLAKNANGAFAYPEVGSWSAGDCSDYNATRMETDCSGTPRPDAGMMTFPDAAVPRDAGAARDVGPDPEDAGSIANDDAGASSSGDAGAVMPPGVRSRGEIAAGCMCSGVERAGGSWVTALFLLLWAARGKKRP